MRIISLLKYFILFCISVAVLGYLANLIIVPRTDVYKQAIEILETETLCVEVLGKVKEINTPTYTSIKKTEDYFFADFKMFIYSEKYNGRVYIRLVHPNENWELYKITLIDSNKVYVK